MRVVVGALFNFIHSSQLLESIVQLLHGPIYTDQIYPLLNKKNYTASLFLSYPLLSGLDKATVWGGRVPDYTPGMKGQRYHRGNSHFCSSLFSTRAHRLPFVIFYFQHSTGSYP
jgi:hypothetical protein